MGGNGRPTAIRFLQEGRSGGRAIGAVPVEEVTAELRKWGVRHLIVWSQASLAYLRRHSDVFAERWGSGPWHEFEYLAADTRDVATTAGSGRIVAFDPLGAQIALDGVQAAAEVVVRTNYHPSWSAHVQGTGLAVPLEPVGGQLGFRAPRDGSYVVTLVYPRRPWLTVLALACVLLGALILARRGRRRGQT